MKAETGRQGDREIETDERHIDACREVKHRDNVEDRREEVRRDLCSCG